MYIIDIRWLDLKHEKTYELFKSELNTLSK